MTIAGIHNIVWIGVGYCNVVHQRLKHPFPMASEEYREITAGIISLMNSSGTLKQEHRSCSCQDAPPSQIAQTDSLDQLD